MTLNEFKELQKAHRKMVVCFSAEWCGPCRVFAPIFHDVTEKLPEYKFLRFNVDNCEEICNEYGVQSIPAILILEGDKVTKERVGGFGNSAGFIQWVTG